MRDRVGDQLAGQQDGIVGGGTPTEDLPHERPPPPHLVIGPREDPPPGPDHRRRGHDARPVPPHAKHSDSALRSNARSPASPAASSERRRDRNFHPRPPQRPHGPAS